MAKTQKPITATNEKPNKNNAIKKPKQKKQTLKKVKDVVKQELLKTPATEISKGIEKKNKPAGKKSQKKAKKVNATKPIQKNEIEETSKTEEQTNKPKRYNPEQGQTVFVGNVPSNTNSKRLSKLFKPFGNVLSIRLRKPDGSMILKHEMRKGVASLNAYVVFDNTEAADKSLSLNGTVINEQRIRVQIADKPANLETQSKSTIFVGNLKRNTTDDDLHQVFSSCGEIDYVRTLHKYGEKGCKGTAFVCFKSPEAVGLALELEKTIVNERPIHVERYSVKKVKGRSERVKDNGLDDGKPKGGNPLVKAAIEHKKKLKHGNKPFIPKKSEPKAKGAANKFAGKQNENKKKSQFRGVKTGAIKKKSKKNVTDQMKKLANKIAPKE